MAFRRNRLPFLNEPTSFEAVFNASPIGMYLVDAELRIRQMSRKALPIFGDIGELIGREGLLEDRVDLLDVSFEGLEGPATRRDGIEDLDLDVRRMELDRVLAPCSMGARDDDRHDGESRGQGEVGEALLERLQTPVSRPCALGSVPIGNTP